MSIEIQGRVGPIGTQQSLGDGVIVHPWIGAQSQVITQDWAPRYSELARRGVLFNGANQAGQAITNLIAAATGLILINPLGSGKNLWVIDIVVAQTSASTTSQPAITLAANTNPLALGSYTLTTPLTINSALLGSIATPSAKLLSSATLPAAPAIVRTIWQAQNLATAATTGSAVPYVKDEVAGAIGVAPGCAISLSATAAISAISSITWCELPI
jgi:hypothetical protein